MSAERQRIIASDMHGTLTPWLKKKTDARTADYHVNHRRRGTRQHQLRSEVRQKQVLVGWSLPPAMAWRHLSFVLKSYRKTPGLFFTNAASLWIHYLVNAAIFLHATSLEFIYSKPHHYRWCGAFFLSFFPSFFSFLFLFSFSLFAFLSFIYFVCSFFFFLFPFSSFFFGNFSHFFFS